MHLVSQLLLALRHMHAQKILHRDLKPGNIFITEKDMVKVGDFGRARVMSDGTPYYISPELCMGKPYNEKADIWALGCIVYELLSFERPFEGHNLHALVLKICHMPYPPLEAPHRPLR